MDRLRGLVNPTLPEGCPFIIGGGLVRDAILGGRPKDIDVWLPYNITAPTLDVFAALLRRAFPQAQVRGIFAGPGAYGDNQFDEVVDTTNGNYGDVNNSWVIEMTHPDLPDVNFMRSLEPWRNDSQAFFNRLMRAFDIDKCMFFLGYMPGQQDVNTVIMPQHMVNGLTSGGIARTHLNKVYWNQYRLNITSQQRIMDRITKMNSKYRFNIPTDMDRILVIPTESIIATPVPLSRIMRSVNQAHSSWAKPTLDNSREPQALVATTGSNYAFNVATQEEYLESLNSLRAALQGQTFGNVAIDETFLRGVL